MDNEHLIIDGNSVYEIDEECLKNRRKKEELKENENRVDDSSSKEKK